MKKLFLSIFVAGLFLSGCSDSNSNKLYLKCKTIKPGGFVTGDYGNKMNEIKYFEIDFKTEKVKSKWDKFNGKFKLNRRTLLAVGEKYIRIKGIGKGVEGGDYNQIDRETGQMTHYRILARKNNKTPISMCEKINKEDLTINKTDKKF